MPRVPTPDVQWNCYKFGHLSEGVVNDRGLIVALAEGVKVSCVPTS
jgi:hypothetical protein